MSTATAPKVHTIRCGHGKKLRTWTDDNVIHLQLATQRGVELGHLTFTGRDATDMALLAGNVWAERNA